MSIELDLSFWEIFWSIVFVLGVGFVSGRILGVRRGFLRATAAGLIGSFIGLVIATIVLRDEAEITGEEIIPLAFGFALLATMVLSVVLEVLLRPRRRVKRASLRTRIKTFFTVGGRLFEVSRIARRNGLTGSVLTSRSSLATPEGGLRIRRFLEDCYSENSRRMSAFEPELLRPSFLPQLAEVALRALRLWNAQTKQEPDPAMYKSARRP